MPYAEYDNYALFDMTTSIIDKLYNFPDGYKLYLVRYMNTAPNFTRFILNANCEAPNAMPELIVTAIKDNLPTIALQLFKSTLTKASEDWKKINQFTENMITRSKDYKEVETIEFFRDNMFPMIKAIPIGMVQDEISGWDAKIVEYIKITVAGSDKYTYSRENAWRLSVPDGKEYGLNPRYYNTEQEYLKDLHEKKYSWRKWYEDRDTLGLDVNNFETQEEYRKAYDSRLEEKWQNKREQREQERRERVEKEQRIEAEKARVDENIYTFCGVLFPHTLHPYHYRTDDTTIKVGDDVLVPVGDKETIGKVVSVGQYMRVAAPYPVDKTKFIIRKAEKELK